MAEVYFRAVLSSQSVENYLKALFALGRETGEVNITELSNALEVSKPAVNGMVKILAARGLVVYKRYRPLSLTPEGRRAAAQVVRKHRLTEMYLVDQMGFGWEEVHEIAEQIEHINAPLLFARMDEIMGFPTHDPHGSPIPTHDGEVAANDYRTLSEAKAGERVKLRAVGNQDAGLLAFLTRKAIGLNTTLDIIEVEGFDGSLRVRYGEGREEVLTREVSRCLLIGREAS